MAHRPGAARPSRARPSRRPRPARLRRGPEALWRTRAPGEGGRPHPARSPRGQGCAGARSSSAPPRIPPISRLASRGAPAALSSGMRLPVRSRSVLALRVATLAPRGVSWFVPILVRRPLAIPVAPAVVPPLSSLRDGGSRPATGARRGGCAVREGREPRAGTACRTRAGIARAAGAEASREGAVRRDRRGGRRDARDAGRPGGRRRDGGGRLPRPRARPP